MATITPSERARNWLAVVTGVLALFGGGIYTGNTKTVQKWIQAEPLPELADEIAEPVSGDIHPEVRQKIEAIINKLDEHGQSIEALEAAGARLRADVRYWHGSR